MTFLSLLTLLATMGVLAAIPSASVALVVTRSATRGIRDGISVAGGIVLGDLIFVALAILGMGLLAETMGSFFVILRYVGGAYLVWLGFSLIRSDVKVNLVQSDTSKISLLASFTSGLLLTLGDIKAILFYASLFPAFVDMSSLQASEIVGLVAVTIVAVGGVKILYAYSAQEIVKRFHNQKAQKLTKTTAGCCMISAGAYVITKA
jgi:threonine/homoserine/homoserine lactone efflux protein